MSKISKDTEAILLLCCRIPKDLDSDKTLKPLSHGEYMVLAKWLFENQYRPCDLLVVNKVDLQKISVETSLIAERLSKLLSRGVALSFARERWEKTGIWILSRADEEYPKRWKNLLKNRAPALLFGAGSQDLMNSGGLGVVGSRHIAPEIEKLVSDLAFMSAKNNVPIVSGGARGVDSIAMSKATDSSGKAFGILADSLLKSLTKKDNREKIEANKLCLVSPYSPEAGFNAGNAMSRNKLIYASSDCVVIAQVDLGKGGTWAGAVECLNHNWVPVLAQMDHPSDGLETLIQKGAQAINLPTFDQFTSYFNRLMVSKVENKSQFDLLK